MRKTPAVGNGRERPAASGGESLQKTFASIKGISVFPRRRDDSLSVLIVGGKFGMKLLS
jgi:hypothetical protein